MNSVFIYVLDILKLLIPAGIVFATVYYILKQFFASQLALKRMEVHGHAAKNTLPLKLQAYERLTLFCDRITLQSLIYRLNASNMTVRDLEKSMLISIQSEFEHNLAQQIYVSDQLWEIIALSKTEVQAIVSNAASKLNDSAPANDLAQVLIAGSREFDPSENAKKAIKSEIKVWL